MTHRAEAPRIDDSTVKKIAERADADERSVWKRLAGGELRGRVARRIDREIALELNDHHSDPPPAGH